MNMDEALSPADQARTLLAQPIFNPVLKTRVGEGRLDYEIYLNTSQLLELQTPADELVSPDELMFQIVHQAQEIWLKLLSHELAELVAEFDDDKLWAASARLDRTVRIVRCLTEELRVLETLTPDTYQVIRRHLGNGSGQESPGYNRLRAVSVCVAQALDRLLTRHGTSLMDIYTGSAQKDHGLKRICESLVDLDENYQTWLFAHFMLVRRTIGVQRDIASLDGTSTQILVGRMTQPLFRSLWKVRAELTAGWSREGGTAPGESRRKYRAAS